MGAQKLDTEAYRSKTGLMTDREGIVTVQLVPMRWAQIAALAFFSLFGFAMLAVFVASVVAPNPGGSPSWACLAVGVAWTGTCVLGIGTNHYVEIDTRASEIRHVLSRFGVRSTKTTQTSQIERVSVFAVHRKARYSYRYEVQLETREEIPFLEMNRVWPLHRSTNVDVANEDGRRIAERLGVPFVPCVKSA